MKAYYLRPGHQPKFIDVRDEPHELSSLVGGEVLRLGLNWDQEKGGLLVLTNNHGFSLGLLRNFTLHLAPFGGPEYVNVVGPAVLVKCGPDGSMIDIHPNDVALFQEALER